MPEPLENPPAPTPAEEPAASANPAAARCCDARSRTIQACLAKGDSEVAAYLDADDAYCRAMPPLSGIQNIRDFIACVAHGLIINVFLESTATKLLYAAQVAFNALPKGLPRGRRNAA